MISARTISNTLPVFFFFSSFSSPTFLHTFNSCQPSPPDAIVTRYAPNYAFTALVLFAALLGMYVFDQQHKAGFETVRKNAHRSSYQMCWRTLLGHLLHHSPREEVGWVGGGRSVPSVTFCSGTLLFVFVLVLSPRNTLWLSFCMLTCAQ